MIKVGRPINGITINGLEWLLTNDGSAVLVFENEESAKTFLREHNLPEEVIENLFYVEI